MARQAQVSGDVALFGARGTTDALRAGHVMPALYAATLLIAACLLFSLEPMQAKMLLPMVGGSPAIWNTVVAFFQLVLLAGYGYAHVLSVRLSVRAQIGVHLTLMALVAWQLPLHVPNVRHDAGGSPEFGVIMTLATSAGLPFFIVAATSPLLQRWFSGLGHRHSADPYFLYAASNAGSLLGLAAYPLIVEPALGVGEQSRLWSYGYALLFAAIALSAAVAWHGRHDRYEGRADALRSTAPSAVVRLRWVLLAFVPSSLALAVTTHITTLVAPMPLFWTLPLGLYLTTFIIAFARTGFVSLDVLARTLPFAVLPVAFLIVIAGSLPIVWDVALHLLAFFVVALACHVTLANTRPAADRLTGFYFWIAIGGTLGGIFNALIAPVVFSTIAEYPVTLVLGCAALGAFGVAPQTLRARLLDVVLPLLLAGAIAFAARVLTASHASLPLAASAKLIVALALVACFTFVRRPIRFALGLGAIFLAGNCVPSSEGRVLAQQRNYFGLKTVMLDPSGRYRQFVHSGTVHGAQSVDPRRSREPLAYYSVQGPLGDVFAARRATGHIRRVAIVGLGIGTLACYARPGERWTYFEIDPAVVRLAENPQLFSFMAHCAPHPDVRIGDARLALQEASDDRYDLIVLDAYSSDQIPVHLITREALQLYLRHLTSHGMLAFNISNRYFALTPVLANLAADAGLAAWERSDGPGIGRLNRGDLPSTFIAMTRTPQAAAKLAREPRWQLLRGDTHGRIWSDDYSSLLSVMRL